MSQSHILVNVKIGVSVFSIFILTARYTCTILLPRLFYDLWTGLVCCLHILIKSSTYNHAQFHMLKMYQRYGEMTCMIFKSDLLTLMWLWWRKPSYNLITSSAICRLRSTSFHLADFILSVISMPSIWNVILYYKRTSTITSVC